MPAIRDFSQQYTTVTTGYLIEFDAPDMAENDLLIAFINRDTGTTTITPYITYPEANQSALLTCCNGTILGAAQGFRNISNQKLTSIKLYLQKAGTPTGNAVLKLYAHSGTFGTGSIPTGAALATSDNFDVATLTTGLVLREFTFSGANQIKLTTSTTYCFSIEYSGTAGNYLQLGTDTSTSTGWGNYSTLTGSTWTAVSTSDLIHYIYYESSAGWAELFNDQTAAATFYCSVWWKKATAADLAFLTYSWNSLTSDTLHGTIISIRDVDTTTPIARYVTGDSGAVGEEVFPTTTTDYKNSMALYFVGDSAATVPSVILGPVNGLFGMDGLSESTGLGWGIVPAVGNTPNNVYFSKNGAVAAVRSVVVVNPPTSTGAAVIPTHTAADLSVYVDPIHGVTAYDGNAVFAANSTTAAIFGTTINGTTLGDATVAALADYGVNSYHSLGQMTGVINVWSGGKSTPLSPGNKPNVAGKNVISHIMPSTPKQIQTLKNASSLKGVVFGMASSQNNFKYWHVHGAGTSWGTKMVPLVINSSYTTLVGSGGAVLQATGTLVDTSISDFSWAISSRVAGSVWAVGSLWVLDTMTLAGGNAAESMGIVDMVNTVQSHEHMGMISQGAKQGLIMMPIQVGNGGTNYTYLNLDSTAIEFPEIYNIAKKNINYCSVANVAGLTYYAGPADHIIHKNSVISSPSRYHWKLHTSSFLNVASVDRARSSNVATINTIADHGLSTGNSVLVRGITDSSYNGTWTVASTPNTTRFTYNCTGGDEGTTADTAGTIGPEYDFSGLSVIGAGTISLARAIHITGLTINDYSTLDMTGLNFDEGVISSVPAGNDTLTTSVATLIENSSINVTGVSSGNRWCSVTTPVRFENNTFTGSASTGHAIRITSPGTYSFVGNVFNSFGANGTNSAAIYNDSENLVTLNISGTTNIPTYRNGTSASTSVVLTATLTIKVVDADGAFITADSQDFTANAGSNVITSAGHNLSNGDIVYFTSGGTLPAGLTANTTYFVINQTTDTFKVSTSSSGSEVDITDTGSGTHTWYSGSVIEITIVKDDESTVYYHSDTIVTGTDAFAYNSGTLGGQAVYINILNVRGFQNKTAYQTLGTEDETVTIQLDDERFYGNVT